MITSTRDRRSLPRLTVIGTGYLGATHAICMSVLGYDVLGLDVDAEKIDSLNSGAVPFFEPGLPELLRKGIEAGRLRFTTSFAEAADFGDINFLYPEAMPNARKAYPQLDYADSALSAARNADLVVLLTERAAFREIDPDIMGGVVAHRRIVDGRHALEPERWRAVGWEYRALGRP